MCLQSQQEALSGSTGAHPGHALMPDTEWTEGEEQVCVRSGSRVPSQVSRVPTLTGYWCWRWEGCRQRWAPQSASQARPATQLLVTVRWTVLGWGLLLQAERDSM